VRGVFKIRNKHISATMDSNESSSVGGKANTTAVAKRPTTAATPRRPPAAEQRESPERPQGAPRPADAKDAKGAAKTKGRRRRPRKKARRAARRLPRRLTPRREGRAAKGSRARRPDYVPKKGDGVYGVTKRRGEGTFQLRDVPYIQYFESGYALHVAYWHDVFGTPRSHGCVNLSPVDAHRVFLWTEPAVPEGWHAINAGEELGEGTVVIIHE
jgi:lipoprotein-anchoring transpeptidase ErfK/SrfK